MPPATPLDLPIARVAVFRALMLGDMLCAVPALRALRAALPDAEVTLVGLPWARGLAERLDCIDEFIDFPGHPDLPERFCDAPTLADFVEGMRQRRFDLAVQLHGSGTIVNPLVASFGARQSAGFRSPPAWWPRPDTGRYVAWPERGHEIERLLVLTDHLGMPRRGLHLEFPVCDEDRRELSSVWPRMSASRPYVCVHAGAQLPSRRWPVERFAAVADGIAAQGRNVVLTGGPAETGLIAQVQACMHATAVNLAGRTSLWALGALLDGAEYVVCNDTGISHVAAALQRPSVVVSSGSDVARWAPLARHRHEVLWRDMQCRPCSHAVCPYGHGCALAVTVADVAAAARHRADAAVAGFAGHADGRALHA